MNFIHKLERSKLFTATAILGYALIPLSIIAYSIYANTGTKKPGPTYADPTGYPAMSKNIASLPDEPEPKVEPVAIRTASVESTPAPTPQTSPKPQSAPVQTADNSGPKKPDGVERIRERLDKKDKKQHDKPVRFQ